MRGVPTPGVRSISSLSLSAWRTSASLGASTDMSRSTSISSNSWSRSVTCVTWRGSFGMPERRSSLRPCGVSPSCWSTYSTTTDLDQKLAEAANAPGVGRDAGGVNP